MILLERVSTKGLMHKGTSAICRRYTSGLTAKPLRLFSHRGSRPPI
jgi:hypothetical protein